MFTVTTAATSTDLTTLAAVKLDLGIIGTDEDVYISSQIPRITSAIVSYLNIAQASDGTNTVGRETLTETFRQKDAYRFGDGIRDVNVEKLILSRYPVTSIVSVVENGITLDPSLYEIDGSTGIILRFDSIGYQRNWCFRKCVVTYIAGWLLPGDSGSTLPHDIENAAICLLKSTRAARTRDPLVKSEDIPGVLSTTYWVGTTRTEVGALPPEIASMLDGYRNVPI